MEYQNFETELSSLKLAMTELHEDIDKISIQSIPKKRSKSSMKAKASKAKEEDVSTINNLLRRTESARREALEYNMPGKIIANDLSKEVKRLFKLLSQATEENREKQIHIQTLQNLVDDLLFEKALLQEKVLIQRKNFREHLKKYKKFD